MAALSCGAGTGGMLEAAFGGMTDLMPQRGVCPMMMKIGKLWRGRNL